MQFKKIERATETGIENMEFIREGKNVLEVIIGDVRIRPADYGNGLKVLIASPYEEGQRYRMTAMIDGFAPTITYHESKYDAESEGARLENKGASFVVEHITVLIDEQGKVVGPADGAPTDASPIPF